MLGKLLPTVDPLKYTLGQVLLSGCKIERSKIEDNEYSGISDSWFADATKIKGKEGRVFIKHDEAKNLNHEVAAYHVARLSGLVDVAPCTVRLVSVGPTYEGPGNRHKCVVSLFWNGYEQGESDTDSAVAFRERCRLFDYLIDNGDRHPGNIMSNGDHNVAIDHAYGFSTEHCGGGPNSKRYKRVKDVAQYIKNLRNSNILDLLVPLLEPEWLNGFIKRLSSFPID